MAKGASEATVVYTDGACSGNPGPGGWAWAVVPDGPFASGAEPKTTNQRMELRAALEAVRALPGRLEIVTDSTYLANCFRDRWWEGWLRKGWKTSAGKPVVSRDLWEPLVEAHRAGRFGVPRWVKAHADDPYNDAVDRLAVEAATVQRGRSGDRLPRLEELGSRDLPGGRDARLPPGRLVGVFGHRPPELGGYGENPVAAGVRRKLAEILTAKRELHRDLHVVTGLQLGAEQLGAEAAQEAGVPYVVVQPYPEPDGMWPSAGRDRYAELVRRAHSALLLERKKPDSRQKAGAALARRDGWLGRHLDEAIVVWDGDDATVGKLVRTLEARLGEEEVWVVAPGEPG